MRGTARRRLCAQRRRKQRCWDTLALCRERVPEEGSRGGSPHTALLTLCQRRLCQGTRCLASVPVRKENGAALPGYGLSLRPGEIALLGNSAVGREFGFEVSTAACDPRLGRNACPGAAAVLCPSRTLCRCPGPGSRAGSRALVPISTSQLLFHGAGVSCDRGREAEVLAGGNDSTSSTPLRESSCQ